MPPVGYYLRCLVTCALLGKPVDVSGSDFFRGDCDAEDPGKLIVVRCPRDMADDVVREREQCGGGILFLLLSETAPRCAA